MLAASHTLTHSFFLSLSQTPLSESAQNCLSQVYIILFECDAQKKVMNVIFDLYEALLRFLSNTAVVLLVSPRSYETFSTFEQCSAGFKTQHGIYVVAPKFRIHSQALFKITRFPASSIRYATFKTIDIPGCMVSNRRRRS